MLRVFPKIEACALILFHLLPKMVMRNFIQIINAWLIFAFQYDKATDAVIKFLHAICPYEPVR